MATPILTGPLPAEHGLGGVARAAAALPPKRRKTTVLPPPPQWGTYPYALAGAYPYAAVDPGLAGPSTFNADLDKTLRLLGRSPDYSTSKLPAAYTDPLTPAQLSGRASDFVKASVDPIVQEIMRSFGARAQAGAASIADATRQYAGLVAQFAPQIDAGYTDAEGKQAASNAALAQLVGGVGSGDFQAIAGKLADVAAPAAATQNSQQMVEGLGQGSAGQTAAFGAANLDDLIAAGAAEHAYASKLPALAAGQGIYALRDFNSDLQGKLADAIGGVTSQVPGMVASEAQFLQQNEQAKAGNLLQYQGLTQQGKQLGEAAAEGRAGIIGDLIKAGRNTDLQRALARQGVAEDAAKYGMDAKQFYAQLSLEQRKTYDTEAAQKTTDAVNWYNAITSRQGADTAASSAQAAAATDKYNALTGRINAQTGATSAAAASATDTYNAETGRLNAQTGATSADSQSAYYQALAAEARRQDQVDWFNARTNRIIANSNASKAKPAYDAMDSASTSADTFVQGLFKTKKDTSTYPPTETVIAPVYAEARKRLLARYGPSLRHAGVNVQGVNQWVDSTLAAYGVIPKKAQQKAAGQNTAGFPDLPPWAWGTFSPIPLPFITPGFGAPMYPGGTPPVTP